MYNYKIYASLLDSFNWYKKDESEDAKQKFIDGLNRVPFTSDKIEKGKAFEELVELLLEGKQRFLLNPDNQTITFKGHDFKKDILSYFYKYLNGSVDNVYCEGSIQVGKNNVYLYGFADNVKMDNCIDKKTLGQYTFPQFIHKWQKVIYPYCLNQMGIECNSFTYLITDFNNIYKEDYRYDESKAVTSLKNELHDLIYFLETNRSLITDRKIFGLEKELA